MDSKLAVNALGALAQETRLAVFRLLVEAGPKGRAAGEIGERLAIPANTLSFHLKTLTQAGLLEGRQEGRFIFYAANYVAMDELIAFLTDNCCNGGSCLPKTAAASTTELRRQGANNQTTQGAMPMPSRSYNVLFLCTGNSARSIMAEAILNQLGGDRFSAFSAGSHPGGQVNPLALDQLRRAKLPTEGLRSKSWDEFATDEAPRLDFVFTVCDNAAGEVCPVWPGQPMTAHWGVADPAALEGSDEQKRRAFSQAFAQLNRRISLFVSLPLAKLDAMALKGELDGIGRLSESGQ